MPRRVLLTGATGLIGNTLARKLAARGDRVRALVRDPDRARPLLPAETELVRGDITEPSTLGPALQGVALLFHCAGAPEQWAPDEAVFDRVNRQGTRNVLEAALEKRVDRAVVTSTMDVFAAPRGGTLVETNLDPDPKPSAYERSKQAAEREAETVRDKGLDVVFVNPGAVYGPSPVHVTLNSFFLRLLRRKMPVLPPGGVSLAFVDGVADAHLAAAERGRSGERYLVADDFVTHKALAVEILKHSPNQRVPPTAPAWALHGLAVALAPVARTFHFTPLITRDQLGFLLWSARIDAGKAQRELGFIPTTVSAGVAQTVAFLRAQKLVPAV